MGLMKPLNESDMKNQEKFQEIRENSFKVDRQIQNLEKTIFEDGNEV